MDLSCWQEVILGPSGAATWTKVAQRWAGRQGERCRDGQLPVVLTPALGLLWPWQV